MGFGGFPKLGGTLLGDPILRTIVFGDLYWDPYLGKLPYRGLRVSRFMVVGSGFRISLSGPSVQEFGFWV